jgi:hypothetical protein
MEQIKTLREILNSQSKKIIWELYCQTVPFRSYATSAQTKKSWMIQEIIEAKFGHISTTDEA